jgi:hypothetical protein
MIRECLKSKIINSSGKLQPYIYSAIFELYSKGEIKVSANMVRDKCNSLNPETPWAGRIPAICNSMRNLLDCGATIISDNRDFGNFSIIFSGANKSNNKINSLVITPTITEKILNKKSTPKNKSSLKIFVNEKLNEVDIENFKDKKKIKLLIIGCSNNKNEGGVVENSNNYFNQNLFKEFNEARLNRYNQYEGLLINKPEKFGVKYKDLIVSACY